MISSGGFGRKTACANLFLMVVYLREPLVEMQENNARKYVSTGGSLVGPPISFHMHF
jgi:hypothetical protein